MKLTGLRDGVGDSGHVFGDDLKKETVLERWKRGGKKRRKKRRRWDKTIFQSEPFGQHMRDERDSKGKQTGQRKEGGRMRLDWNPSDESADMVTMQLNPPSVASPKEDKHVMSV